MIPANITSQLTFLQGQVKQNSPLINAPRATVVAMQLNAAALVASVQQALIAPNNLLDTWTASSDPVVVASDILRVTQAALDQANLSLLRGVTGRVASNLNQVV